MKAWILQLMAVLLWVALHHNFMANAHDIYPQVPEPKPIMEMNVSDEDRKVIFTETKSLVIMGLNRLCLEVHRFAPKLVGCKTNAAAQKWRFFRDGTIRPETDPLKCLTVNELSQRAVILVLPCNFSSSAYTVWLYRSAENTIVNRATNLVMDLSESRGLDGSEAQIFILFRFTGNGNQKWYVELEEGSRQLSLL